jgi:hypothetical protein
MSFESSNFNERSEGQEHAAAWETPEALEAKIKESVGIIMSLEDADEVEKMAVAEKIAETFPAESGQKLMARVAEEIQKSKESQRFQDKEAAKEMGNSMGIAGQEGQGKTREGERRWRRQHSA